MTCLETEVRAFNSLHFSHWCSHLLLNESSFHPLRNPLQHTLHRRNDSTFSSYSAYFLCLPIHTTDTEIMLGPNFSISYSQRSIPLLTFQGLYENGSPIIFGDVLLLFCEPISTQCEIPPFLALSKCKENVYSIRSIVCGNKVYKRLFSVPFQKGVPKKALDVFSFGRWICIEGGYSHDVLWSEIKFSKANLLHYERLVSFHVCSKTVEYLAFYKYPNISDS